MVYGRFDSNEKKRFAGPYFTRSPVITTTSDYIRCAERLVINSLEFDRFDVDVPMLSNRTCSDPDVNTCIYAGAAESYYRLADIASALSPTE